jgi:hypothetical protein
MVVAVSYHGRNPRLLDLTDDLAVDLALACGIGMSVNDTRRRPFGLAYARFRLPKPLGGALALIRALANAGPWQVVKQIGPDGSRHDYHSLRRRDLSTKSVRSVWEEGKKSRVPKRGRQHLLEAAALCWIKNHERAGLTGSLEDHLADIRSALAIGDERHHAYLISLASNTL